MKSKFNFLILICLALLSAGCGSEALNAEAAIGSSRLKQRASSAHLSVLDEFAELERAGSWIEGMALTESTIRESAGDFAGAVVAAYKELAWAYGKGLIQKSEMENGILNLLTVNSNDAVIITSHIVLSFLNGHWDDAAFDLKSFFNELDEPDGFARWMILVCELEKNGENKRAAAAYKSIRARYVQFPEYWYRGARAFSGAVGAGFAENCINSSPDGPFAGECRSILAVYSGLRKEDGASIKTMLEIESIIYQSVNSGNPAVLDLLMPLIGLPENPYAVYAAGALRALTNLPEFNDYFSRKASAAAGHLAERLSYICGS